MQELHADPDVFIRSMATRGHLGGLAAATSDLVVLLEAAGFDPILIETVGVGQDEIDVARVADVTAVVLVPGLGDDVQALKAGIMEVADVYILNKADYPGIDKLEQEVKTVLAMAPAGPWTPPVARTVAVDGTGIDHAFGAIKAFRGSGLCQARQAQNWAYRLLQMYRESVTRSLDRRELERAAADVAARRTDPYSTIEKWLSSTT
jgi:LAO/AO transport system kinase